MTEYLSEAIILAKEPNGDLDVRISVFTKKFGKLRAKAKSARKITSKLSAHLEPGTLSQVRIVEKNGLQIVDALKHFSLSVPPSTLYFLDRILAEGEPEPAIWHALASQKFNWKNALAVLGWDPGEAACHACNKRNPSFFDIRDQIFLCDTCRSQNGKNQLLYIGN